MDSFEMSGTAADVTVLRLKTLDVSRIEAELRAHIASDPLRFLHAPVIVDVSEIGVDAMDLPLADLAERLRACKLVPLGAANLPAMAVWYPAASGMAVVQLGGGVARPVDPQQARPLGVEPPRAEPPPAATAETLVVREPVRSGQVIYAERTDLVVVGPVNAGAQVVADGHIHIYGPLRGRAFAGAQGRAGARIFCDSLEAELIAIAGRYLISDMIPAAQRGRRARIGLHEGRLQIET